MTTSEKRYVYGNRLGNWVLVGKEDRDFQCGIPEEDFTGSNEQLLQVTSPIVLSGSVYGF